MIFLTRDLLVSRLHHVPGQSLVYLNNSKVACSTIKRSLWEAADAQAGKVTYTGLPHERGMSPFLQRLPDMFQVGLEPILTSEWFSVVRNPFVRALSAYLNKIPVESRDPHVWEELRRRFRMPEGTPSFGDFLQMLLTESVPDSLDWHFCPQVSNLLYGFAPLSFVGQLEAMDEVESWLSARGIAVKSVDWHATNAREMVDRHYGPAEVEAVRKIYRADFEQFGYSPDPGVLEPLRPVALQERDPKVMRLFLRCYEPSPGEARRAAYKELAEIYGDAEFLSYLLLDAGLADWDEVMATFDGLVSGRIRNWRTAIKLGHALAYREMALEAAKALEIACATMYPRAAPDAAPTRQGVCLAI